MMELKDLPCPWENYYYIFQEDATGIAVFQELCAAFYDIEVFTPDPYKTAYLAGQRSVLHEIIRKMANEPEKEEE